jgi:hypothetical protein
VKLWQFDPADRSSLSLDTGELAYYADPARPGVELAELFRDKNEVVTLERWRAGAEVPLPSPAGLELLVLEGGFTDEGERFDYQSWLRLPSGASARASAGPTGCRVWAKRGHLARPPMACRIAG